jgi:putative transposase
VIHTYGLAARRRRQKYIYPGKAAQTAPNVVRELEPDSQQHVVFSDIFEVRLADQSRVRGCLLREPKLCQEIGRYCEYRGSRVTNGNMDLNREAGKQLGSGDPFQRAFG